MADNPYAERPAGSATGKKKNQCPPDMPRGGTDADKAARVRFWLDLGDAHLAAEGKGHLCWKHANGNYWIEPR